MASASQLRPTHAVILTSALAIGAVFCLLLAPSVHAAAQPGVNSIIIQNQSLLVSASVPAGYRHAVLEATDEITEPFGIALVAGAIDGRPGIATFRLPEPDGVRFLRVRLGTDAQVPSSEYSGSEYFQMEYSAGTDLPLTPEEQAGHVLNRLAHGPTPSAVESVLAMGAATFVEQQLNPELLGPENPTLLAREEELFSLYYPSKDDVLIAQGELWRYFKGTQAPPAAWKNPGFDDASWPQGPTGIGYGDNDDATELEDMRQTTTQPGYISVFLRKTFNLSTPLTDESLLLQVDFDDGFVAYLNGVEIARANLTGNPPAYNARADNDREAGEFVEYDLSAYRHLLQPGENVLAIQVHNTSLTSSDLTLIPKLVSRTLLPLPPEKRIRGIEALQQLAHLRGIYSERQLQTVLAEFWENHFTTDYDKVAEFLSELENSDGQEVISDAQAEAEAAQIEYLEYQFFHDNALGNFGDLLLFSATSPAQLIYLDNVLNVKGAPNENYGREILELFAFGVDNRYTQEDIEQLARCFTGWTIRKVWPDQKLPFPASARTPPTEPSVQFEDTVILDVGPGWRYFKGTREPTPDPTGAPTLAWTQPDFNDASWTSGATSIGFGDGDDATVLSDMRNNYVSVYLRREFTISGREAAETLLLSVDYDDGFVAYLNGTEIARSRTMRGTGTPPAFNQTATGNHEAGEKDDFFSLRQFAHLLRSAPEPNVLAIQAHNVSSGSSDFSIHPRLVDRRLLPGSIENGDPNGVWTFRFNPEEHDPGAKVLFRNTPNQFSVPAGRTGPEGLRDALDAIDFFVGHPSTSEFICLKLINKFVSDEISLPTYKDGTAPESLRQLLDGMIQAWHSTVPPGNIRTVMETLLSPRNPSAEFWSRATYRAKVKTPIEFINSSVRALGPDVSGTELPEYNERLGMHLFTRDDPDGWSELGGDWVDTGTLLSRIQFAQDLTGGRVDDVNWNVTAWASAHGLTTAESIVDHFNRLLFQGAMSASNRNLLIEFATTDDTGNPLPLTPQRNDYGRRVRELVGLILSMPQWHYQ